MPRMRFAVAVVATLIVGLLGVATTTASAAERGHTRAHDVVTLTYDASQAGSWADYIKQAVQNWNAVEHNVQLAPVSQGATADFDYVATSGWPETTLGPIFPGGHGEVQLGQQAVSEGYDPTRIVAHETGHIFGLPDDYSGPCSEIMSGHGPGTSCTNAKPDAAEAAQVDKNYASGEASARPRQRVTVVDVWSDRALAK